MVKVIRHQDILQSLTDDTTAETAANEYIRISETELANKLSLLKVLKAILCGSFMRSTESEIFRFRGGDTNSSTKAEGVVKENVNEEEEEKEEGKNEPLIAVDANQQQQDADDDDDETDHHDATNTSFNTATTTRTSRVLRELQTHTGYDSVGTLSGKRHRKKAPITPTVELISTPAVSKKKAAAIPKQTAIPKQKAVATNKRKLTNIKIKVEKNAPKIKKKDSSIEPCILVDIAAVEAKTRSSTASQNQVKEANDVYAKNAALLQQIQEATATALQVQAALKVSTNSERINKSYAGRSGI